MEGLLSTDTDLTKEKIVQKYDKRSDIEAFFKVVKQNLKLAKEIQSRDFDALIDPCFNCFYAI